MQIVVQHDAIEMLAQALRHTPQAARVLDVGGVGREVDLAKCGHDLRAAKRLIMNCCTSEPPNQVFAGLRARAKAVGAR